jgi:MraZ protein
MSTFIGKYEAKADVKGRVFVPSAYRKLLPETDRERVVVRRDADHACLIIYPVDVWNQRVDELKSVLDEWNPEDRLILMQFVSDAEWLDIDSQGRVLISKKHMQAIIVDNAEIVFVGINDRFAVWGKASYEKTQVSSDRLAQLLKEKMMKKT